MYLQRGKYQIDHTNAPVPGSINGSCVKNLIKSPQSTDEKHEKINQNGPRSADAQVNSQVNHVMKNMQTVLESVLLELHQSKEDNLKFKQDVSNQLHDIFFLTNEILVIRRLQFQKTYLLKYTN